MNNDITSKDDGFFVSQGEYSDYFVSGAYRANELIVWKDAIQKYIELHPEQKEPYSADFDKFTTWLVEQGKITKVEMQEIHLGSYSSWNG